MDAISFPDNEAIQALDPDQLTKLAEQVAARADELESADLTEEVVNELTRLADQTEAIDAEVARRDNVKAELENRRRDAANRLRKDEVDPDNPDANAEADDDDDDEKKNKVVGEQPDAEIAAADQEPALAAAGASKGVRGDAKALADRQPARTKPKADPNAGYFKATGFAEGYKENTQFATTGDIATVISDMHLKSGSYAGSRQEMPIAHASKPMGDVPKLSRGTAFEMNFGILHDVQMDAKSHVDSLVASGVSCMGCALYEPSYEFFRLAEVQNPMEDGISVVQAPRGGINYIVPPSLSLGAGAIDLSTSDRDYEETFEQFVSGPKACVTVTCPNTDQCEVTAVSQCVTFDNLGYKVFPELVASFLEDIAVLFTATKEVFWLDCINSQSTQVTSDFGYGFSRSLLFDWVTATVAYRKRHRMSPNANLIVAAPDWVIPAIKLDMALDGQMGVSQWDITDAQVNAWLSQRGITPIWYNDNPTGVTPNQRFDGTQATGALNQWPVQVRSFIFAPGTFVRLDGGTLDVGLVRDSTLNRTNDLQLFMEEWIGCCKLGFESVSLTSTLCVNGGGPELTTLRTC